MRGRLNSTTSFFSGQVIPYILHCHRGLGYRPRLLCGRTVVYAGSRDMSRAIGHSRYITTWHCTQVESRNCIKQI